MAATARAVTADEEGPDLGGGHSPKLTPRHQAMYEAGLFNHSGCLANTSATIVLHNSGGQEWRLIQHDREGVCWLGCAEGARSCVLRPTYQAFDWSRCDVTLQDIIGRPFHRRL